MKFIMILVLFVLLLTVSPLITIWSLNILFGLSIPMTFWTWFATLWLTSLIAVRINRK